jgi:hypothetical protein
VAKGTCGNARCDLTHHLNKCCAYLQHLLLVEAPLGPIGNSLRRLALVLLRHGKQGQKVAQCEPDQVDIVGFVGDQQPDNVPSTG